MTALLRPLAELDLIRRAEWYRTHAGDGVAERFFDAAIVSLRALERLPGAGSPRVGELCGIPGLRVRRVAGFPCSWCYFVHPGHIDVVRLVADAEDLPTILADMSESPSER